MLVAGTATIFDTKEGDCALNTHQGGYVRITSIIIIIIIISVGKG